MRALRLPRARPTVEILEGREHAETVVCLLVSFSSLALVALSFCDCFCSHRPHRFSRKFLSEHDRPMCPPPQTRNATAEIKRAPLPSRRRKDGLIRFARDDTSQGGEDGILQAIYDCLGDGPRTLVDVGAWDGVHLSNTHSLLVPDTSTWRGF